jgi:exodeoxyribonuclease VII small subunit
MTEKTENFEEKLESAKSVLEILMKPEITLADSVKAYEKGMKELSDAQLILENAVIKIKEIKNT